MPEKNSNKRKSKKQEKSSLSYARFTKYSTLTYVTM